MNIHWLKPEHIKAVKKYLKGNKKKKVNEIVEKGTEADIRFMQKYNLLMKELGTQNVKATS